MFGLSEEENGIIEFSENGGHGSPWSWDQSGSRGWQ